MAIAGATGAVGQTMLSILAERNFPVRGLRLLASERSEGKVLHFKGEEVKVERLTARSFEGIELALFSAGASRSKEFAPEALKRWGIRGIVGGSFAEIFFGNSTALGIPCLTVAPQDVEWLMGAVAHHPEREIVLDVEAQRVRLGDRTIPARLPDAARKQLLTGTWNATAVLLDAGEEIERVAKGLPYLRGY